MVHTPMICADGKSQKSRGNQLGNKGSMSTLGYVTNCTRINGTACNKSCFLVPENYQFTVLPGVYLFLAILGFLTNGLAILDLWKNKKTPTVIFTLNIVVSDLMLCCSFPFRMAYYIYSTRWKAGTVICSVIELLMISCFYINIYCNMSFLLWTSINRWVTVTRLRGRLFLVFKRPRLCWFLCLFTWIVGSTFVIGPMAYKVSLKSKGQVLNSCFDQFMNKKPAQMNGLHSLGVGIFFFMLGLMLVSYGLLLFHLHKVNQKSLVDTRLSSGLKVRRKILASVVLFVICFLPYHVQRIRVIASKNNDCRKKQEEFCLKTLLILVAALSCCLNPVLYLVLQLPCCRAKRNIRNHLKADMPKSPPDTAGQCSIPHSQVNKDVYGGPQDQDPVIASPISRPEPH